VRLAIGLATVVVAGWMYRLRRSLVLVTVNGLSMEPTYRAGDRLVLRRAQRMHSGDVVVVRDSRRGLLVKRIAAIAGQAVPPAVLDTVGTPIVPIGQVVLLGDNPAVSFDSRQAGFFAVEDVLGRIERRLIG
jgi:signal peptidase I